MLHNHTHTPWHHLLLSILLKSAAGCMNAAIVHQEELDNSQTFPTCSIILFLYHVYVWDLFKLWIYRMTAQMYIIHRNDLWSVVKYWPENTISGYVLLPREIWFASVWPQLIPVLPSVYIHIPVHYVWSWPLSSCAWSYCIHTIIKKKGRKSCNFFKVLFLDLQRLFWVWISNYEQLYFSLLWIFCIFPQKISCSFYVNIMVYQRLD